MKGCVKMDFSINSPSVWPTIVFAFLKSSVVLLLPTLISEHLVLQTLTQLISLLFSNPLSNLMPLRIFWRIFCNCSLLSLGSNLGWGHYFLSNKNVNKVHALSLCVVQRWQTEELLKTCSTVAELHWIKRIAIPYSMWIYLQIATFNS